MNSSPPDRSPGKGICFLHAIICDEDPFLRDITAGEISKGTALLLPGKKKVQRSKNSTHVADIELADNRLSGSDKPRAEFIDHLRVLLTALVLFHHAAIAYGAPGGWYYHETPTPGISPTTSCLLTMFVATNQAFFMGFFFLLAGYFTPASLAKKGYRSFLIDRLIRLGIPLLVYGFFLSPLTIALAATAKDKAFLDSFLSCLGQFHAGPLWFAEALLIFTGIYVLFCFLKKKDRTPPEPASLPGHLIILISALSVGAVSLLIRQWFPVGKEFLWLQLGFFSSYTFLFYLGCFAWHHRWLEKVESRLALPWLMISLAAISGFCLTAILSGYFHGSKVDFSGGLSIYAIIHAFEEPLAAWGIILALLWLFHQKVNQHSKLGHLLAQRAYAIYIIHPPILVGLSLLLRPWHASPLLKFPLVATLAFCCCALISGILFQLAGAKRVIG